MPAMRYRFFIDGNPATREQLDQVEQITVEQQVDMAWEARLQIPICTDDNGRWSDEDSAFVRSSGRVRVEIKIGDDPFTALIDGPVVGSDTEMSSEPGQSVVTVLVHDDSAYLNRNDRQRRLDNLLDHEIARQLFGDVPQIASTDVETTTTPNDSLPAAEMQRGTEIELLRRLARRQGMHAYVLPGREPGQSIGVFRRFPTAPDGLPPLILLGPDRNLASFTARGDAQRPGSVESQSVNITDKVVTRATARIRNLELLGEEAPVADAAAAGTRLIPPGHDGAVDVNQAVAAEMERSSYAFEASGSVLGDCYTGVLTPYRVVTVKGVDGRQSGNYVIKSVTHQLTRSQYAQSFSLLRNARSSGASSSNLLGDLAAGIF
jgi:hypothetical protein